MVLFFLACPTAPFYYVCIFLMLFRNPSSSKTLLNGSVPFSTSSEPLPLGSLPLGVFLGFVLPRCCWQHFCYSTSYRLFSFHVASFWGRFSYAFCHLFVLFFSETLVGTFLLKSASGMQVFCRTSTRLLPLLFTTFWPFPPLLLLFLLCRLLPSSPF